MAEETRLEPQIGEGDTSPLSALIATALKLWGNSHPDAVDGGTVLMFLNFANRVVQDVNQHPYFAGYRDRIAFYKDTRDRRPIADLIVVNGLLHYYAQQQLSQKLQVATPDYYRTLNSILWDELSGSGRIEVIPRDHGEGRSRINGQVESSSE